MELVGAHRYRARFVQCEHLQPADQIGVGARRLDAVALETGQNLLDAIDAGEDDADAVDRDGSAIAILAHESLGRMGQPGEPVQA